MRRLEVGESDRADVSARPKWNHTGFAVRRGECYQLTAIGTWKDLHIVCGPGGYSTASAPWESKWLLFLAQPFRRIVDANWCALIVTVGEDDATAVNVFANQRGESLSATWTAPADGELCCFANDHPWTYGNNSGSVELVVRRIKAGGDA